MTPQASICGPLLTANRPPLICCSAKLVRAADAVAAPDALVPTCRAAARAGWQRTGTRWPLPRPLLAGETGHIADQGPDSLQLPAHQPNQRKPYEKVMCLRGGAAVELLVPPAEAPQCDDELSLAHAVDAHHGVGCVIAVPGCFTV